MKPWVLWCAKHKLISLPKMVCVILAPFYVLGYWKEAVKDWKRDWKEITGMGGVLNVTRDN